MLLFFFFFIIKLYVSVNNFVAYKYENIYIYRIQNSLISRGEKVRLPYSRSTRKYGNLAFSPLFNMHFVLKIKYYCHGKKKDFFSFYFSWNMICVKEKKGRFVWSYLWFKSMNNIDVMRVDLNREIKQTLLHL